MISWYLDIIRILREVRKKSQNALDALKSEDEGTAKIVNAYLKTDYEALYNLWAKHFPVTELGYLGRHIRFGMENDYQDILLRDITSVEVQAEKHLRENLEVREPLGFEDLLHPIIYENAYQQFRNGHLRDAVLNSVVAIFDLIRQRTGLGSDGDRLIGEALSVAHPLLILSEIETESGRNDQVGFMQIFQGMYKGVRNPKAHSLAHDLNEQKAAQYLVFASLLARRIYDAKQP